MIDVDLLLCSFLDVDTPEPDEKSIITYVSQLYDVFPEPPPGHPLFDVEAQKRLQQFRDLASSLHQWIKEQIVVMQVSTPENPRTSVMWNYALYLHASYMETLNFRALLIILNPFFS